MGVYRHTHIEREFGFQVVSKMRNLPQYHTQVVSCLGLASDGSALCTGSWDQTLKVCVKVYIFMYIWMLMHIYNLVVVVYLLCYFVVSDMTC